MLLRSSLRYLARHPWLLGLSILGVALGVSVVVGIDLANESATRAFDLATEAVTGRATHQVLGGPSGVPEELFVRLARERPDVPAAPVVAATVVVEMAEGTKERAGGGGEEEEKRTGRGVEEGEDLEGGIEAKEVGEGDGGEEERRTGRGAEEGGGLEGGVEAKEPGGEDRAGRGIEEEGGLVEAAGPSEAEGEAVGGEPGMEREEAEPAGKRAAESRESAASRDGQGGARSGETDGDRGSSSGGGDERDEVTDATRTLQLLGIDPFSERPFREHLAFGESGVDVGELIATPGAALLAAGTAAELGIEVGERFEVLLLSEVGAAGAGFPTRELLLSGTLSPSDAAARRAVADLLVTDIATAQEATGTLGRLTRIDLILEDGADTGGAGAPAPLPSSTTPLGSLLPPGIELVPAAARTAATREMTRAFRLNLRALSLLALVCGLFLIYNTVTFSVVQRRTLLGTLRAVGVTRRQVVAMVLAEAAVVGAAGALVGTLAGIVLGRGLVRLVARTIDDLYFSLEVSGLAVAPASLAQGLALGTVATLATALPPAVEAARAAPREVASRSYLEGRVRRALPRVSAAGAGLAAVGAAVLALSSGLGGAFAGLFAVILGAALLVPGATVLLARGAAVLARPFGVLGRLAARGVVGTLSRTGVAVAALVVAVSVTVGVGTMVASFRDTVERWLESTLEADLYVAPADPGAGGRVVAGATVAPELARRLGELPGVARVSTIRRTETESVEDGRVVRTALGAMDTGPEGRASFRFVAGEPEEVWPAFSRGAVIVSEPLAYRRGLAPGDRLTLATDRGPVDFPVAGVYTDFASDRGTALLARRVYDRHWNDPSLSAVSLLLAPGADLDAVAAAVRRSAGPGIVVRSNRDLKRRSLEVFDRTFRITDVLRLLAALVAFVGIVAALTALELERARELGVLRANGLTPRGLFGLVTTQTSLLGAAAGLLSLPLGLVLAAIMVHVINRRSFGWSLDLSVEPRILADAVLLALGAALLAGLWPAARMARTRPAEALREE